MTLKVLDMERDHNKRLGVFSDGASFEVRRIALNREQIDRYTPPPNYAKVTSTRYREYTKKHGVECWELDALEPHVIDDLLDNTIQEYVDADMWVGVEDLQNEERKVLGRLTDYLPERQRNKQQFEIIILMFLKESENEHI